MDALDCEVRISVIIPVFNTEKFVCSAIDSVLNQTTKPFEIIIIDDGSSDSSPQLLEVYRIFPFVTIITTENRGVGPARNLGIELAKGNYIYFFDSDDCLDRNFFADMISIIKAKDFPDIIFFSGVSFMDNDYTSNQHFFPRYRRGISESFESGYQAFLRLIEKNIFFSSPNLFLSKKKIWEINNLRFKSIIHEDEEILFPLIVFSSKIIIEDKVYFLRRIRSNSIMTTRFSMKNLEGYEVILNSLFKFRNNYSEKYIEFKDCWRWRLNQYTVKLATKAGGLLTLKQFLLALRCFLEVPSYKLFVIIGIMILKKNYIFLRPKAPKGMPYLLAFLFRKIK